MSALSRVLDAEGAVDARRSVPPRTAQPVSPYADVASADGDVQTEVCFVPHPRLALVVVVEAAERVHELRGSFFLQLTTSPDGTVTADHKTLPIHGYGASADAAIRMFAEMFDAMYMRLLRAEAKGRLSAHAAATLDHFRAVVENTREVASEDK